ncbi:MAG: UDP-N-acetylmuramoyl-L-alanyl-D-glutamate--2,6-diaminopimelate ligase [Acidimicrobiia bacterium]|nr:UDP-N-acetylmuramoyl-L-alanyl-D-glutamate--2,6-diaminopimelate ligase [Acidimicrobiia bacterium]
MADLGEVAAACDAELVGGPTVRIVDATHDSRQVEPGWLYCCVPGHRVDGHDFAPEAASAGAVALLVERRLDVHLPQLVVPSVRAAMGPVAAEIHGHPSRQIQVLGVTGTNGKSSIVQLLADIYQQSGLRADIVGTLKNSRTTPEATDLQRLLAQAARAGHDMIAIEVSSHALVMGRVDGTRFASTIFTNLGHDHLDFHASIEDYFLAKARLFTEQFTDHHVINIDDPYGRRLAGMAPGKVDTYSLADADNLHYEGPSSSFSWRGRQIMLPLAGAHNVGNALAAAVCAEAHGIAVDAIVAGLAATRPVRGRFEMVGGSQPFHVAVDYAHTPDAMEAALVAARQVAGSNRVLVVFGCGGDRDAKKRPEMGRVAEKGADVVIVTSDNPRSEDPEAIIEAIMTGIGNRDHVMVEPDRAEAIGHAIDQASAGDIVLIAGKGHETYQIIGDETLHFDDVEVAAARLEALA